MPICFIGGYISPGDENKGHKQQSLASPHNDLRNTCLTTDGNLKVLFFGQVTKADALVFSTVLAMHSTDACALGRQELGGGYDGWGHHGFWILDSRFWIAIPRSFQQMKNSQKFQVDFLFFFFWDVFPIPPHPFEYDRIAPRLAN